MNLYPACMKNHISKNFKEKDSNLITLMIDQARIHCKNTDLCSSILKFLSRVFMLKQQKSEAFKFQIETIVKDISLFWALCRPKDLSENTEDDYDQDNLFYGFIDLTQSIEFSKALNTMKMLFALLKHTLNYKNNGVLTYADIDFMSIFNC